MHSLTISIATTAVATPRLAASVLVLRKNGSEVLMGRRGAKAVFPNAFVFPGGCLSMADESKILHKAAANRLCANPRKLIDSFAVLATIDHSSMIDNNKNSSKMVRLNKTALASMCVSAATRELHEETGVSLSATRTVSHAPLHYVARATTSRGQPKR